jgi:hypothetical protein
MAGLRGGPKRLRWPPSIAARDGYCFWNVPGAGAVGQADGCCGADGHGAFVPV